MFNKHPPCHSEADVPKTALSGTLVWCSGRSLNPCGNLSGSLGLQCVLRTQDVALINGGWSVFAGEWQSPGKRGLMV